MATDIYRQLAERQLGALPKDWPVEIHYAPRDSENQLRDWLGDPFSYIPQAEGTLGDRLAQGVKHAFASGARSVYCIGGDCPTLNAEDFQLAQQTLDAGKDLVFGPAKDGGYYLVGLRQHCPEIFANVPWSASNTLEVSLQNAETAGRKVGLLEGKTDVDEPMDWERVRGKLRGGL